MHVTLEQAHIALAAAQKRAVEIDTRMCIAVVDSGANLKAFVPMDDAWVGSSDIAVKKAKTACFYGRCATDGAIPYRCQKRCR